jgi:hypothetical protein
MKMKETPCRAIFNKQKCLFIKNEEEEYKTGPVWGSWYQWDGEDTRKG